MQGQWQGQAEAAHSCARAAPDPTSPQQGAPACASCAEIIEQLADVQEQRGFTILSHSYAAGRPSSSDTHAGGGAAEAPVLRVHTRCTRCRLTLTWRADELIQPHVHPCPTCQMTEAARNGSAYHAQPSEGSASAARSAAAASSSGSAGAAAAPVSWPGSGSGVGPALPLPLLPPLSFPPHPPPPRSDGEAAAAAAPVPVPVPASSEEGDEEEDEDEGEEGEGNQKGDDGDDVVVLLHRRVVTHAMKLKRAERKRRKKERKAMGGTKEAPIQLLDDEEAKEPPRAAAPAPPVTPVPAQPATADRVFISAPPPAPGTSGPAHGAATSSRFEPNVVVGRSKRTRGSFVTGEAEPVSHADTRAKSHARTVDSAELSSRPPKRQVRCTAPHAASSAQSIPPPAAAAASASSASSAARASSTGASATASGPSDFYSSFVPPSASTAASRLRRQQELFAASRRRLDIRRSLNLEPDMQGGAESLPFRTKDAQKAAQDAAESAAAAAANASASLRSTPFVLPSFFRRESASQPYTASERSHAMRHLIALEEARAPKCDVLCLPGMNPRVWISAVRSACGTGTNALSEAHASSASALLSHHYRRLAKLVHPDKSPEGMQEQAERAFKILQEAYQHMLKLV